MYGINGQRIKLLLGRQYKSKGKYNRDLIFAELIHLLPKEYVVKINETSGYLYITKVT